MAAENGTAMFCLECSQRMARTDAYRDTMAEAVRRENKRVTRLRERRERIIRLLGLLVTLVVWWIFAWVAGWRF